RWMCDNFFDIRTFGAVMSTDVNCGQVRGPVQLGFARSVTPIVSSEFSVTRCAVTTERESEAQQGGNRTMGRKFAVPYGLYRVHGFINPNLAMGDHGTGFSEGDLALLKTALDQMFEHDRSASRGVMRPLACIAFRHESRFGNARADRLFARVTCAPDPGLGGAPPRSHRDFVFSVDESDLPEGVSIERWIDWPTDGM
ncbi:MAG: type I-C CRISPR-associated protein Cas7/Csd2, partial [Planctomycetota bacterium]